MKNWKRFAVLPVLLMLCGCPASRTPLPQPVRASAKGPYVHEGSGMIFPEAVGDFRRGSIFQYDTAGHDVSAGYNLLRLGSAIAATVYVYPAPVDVKIFPIPRIAGPSEPLVWLSFDRVKKEIRAVHPDAELIGEGKVTVTQGDVSKSAYHAVFRFGQPTPYGRQMFLSEAYLFVHGKWFIKYRITYLEAYRKRCVQDAKQFVEGLKWPGGS